MRKAIALLVVLGLAVSAQAALQAYEGVGYAPIGNGDPNGIWTTDMSRQLAGITGQRSTEIGLDGNTDPIIADGWNDYADVANLGALSGSLSYQGADAGLPTTGNRIVGGTLGSMERLLNSPVGDVAGASTTYVSVLMNPGATVNHFCVLDLRDSALGTGTGRLEIGGWGGGGAGYRLIAGNALGEASAGAAVANTTYLFVVRIDFTGDANPDTITYWIDPTLTAGEGANTPYATGTYAGGSYDSIACYYYQDFGEYDEIKVAGSWADLMVVPEPATMTLLAIGGLGVLARRRRR